MPLLWLMLHSALASEATERPEVTVDPGGVPPTVLQAITAAVDHIVALSDDQDGGELERLRRRVRNVVITALATEGYFAPDVTLEVGEDIGGETWDISIKPGERTVVKEVELSFEGAVSLPKFEQRIRTARENWSLPAGQPFRNVEWERAKRDLLAAIAEKDFAYARIQESQALIDPDAATARLTVRIASGPEVLLGSTEISGLRRVPSSLVHRYVRYQPGVTPYDRRQLITWQQEMQSTSFFSSVDVVLDTGARRRTNVQRAAEQAASDADPDKMQADESDGVAKEDNAGVRDDTPSERRAAAESRITEREDASRATPPDNSGDNGQEAADDQRRGTGLRFSQLMAEDSITIPLRVDVVEAPARRVGLSLGVDSDVGLRGEALYQQNVVAGRAVELRTGIGLNRKQQRGFVDLYMPPAPRGYRNRFGLLVEHSDIEGKNVSRAAVGAIRSQTRHGAGDSRVEYETNMGLIASHEKVRFGTQSYTLPTLISTFDWLRRDVDNKYDPREGHLIAAGVGIGTALNESRQFARSQARAQMWWTVGQRDLITVRGEVGKVWAASDTRIPADFGFRTGGARTIRGYRYLGIGHESEGAILGARALAVASVEYQHYFTEMLGMGVFVDAGDAAQSFRDMRVAVGVGAGLRVRTPAGPIFFDLAYAERDKRLRLNFSLGIAF